jgi:MerR family transcriptional regulator, copper efflux regulator
MKLPDLIEAAADPRVTPRFVRFLIAEGHLPPPTGGRAHATYGTTHLTGLRRYLRMRDMGLSVGAIKALAEGVAPEAVAVDLGPGLILTIRPAELADPPDPGQLAERIARAFEDLAASRTDSLGAASQEDC